MAPPYSLILSASSIVLRMACAKYCAWPVCQRGSGGKVVDILDEIASDCPKRVTPEHFVTLITAKSRIADKYTFPDGGNHVRQNR
jgi:hypothetical protein